MNAIRCSKLLEACLKTIGNLATRLEELETYVAYVDEGNNEARGHAGERLCLGPESRAKARGLHLDNDCSAVLGEYMWLWIRNRNRRSCDVLAFEGCRH